MDKPEEFEVLFSDPLPPAKARAGGHGTSEYLLLQDFLRALETGEKPRLDEGGAMDLTVPGIVAHESALNGGVWMDVPSFDREPKERSR